ncbi:hypothetical protein BDF22DRAFT_695388 [Syncephalis plumigaleata]|nr:hypothetical protein BDF22DRAFT_695388 [Syncephalis plumigaleata]
MDTEWQKNATTWAGIPLHPLGEIPIYDYISGDNTEYGISRAESQARLIGILQKTVTFTVLPFIFVRNFLVSIKIINSHAGSISGWCCLIASAIGSGLCLLPISVTIFRETNCRHLSWALVLALCLSTIANGIIILHKAYLALLRQRWVVITGAFFVSLQLGFMIAAIRYTPITINQEHGCAVNYGTFLSYAWIGTVLPVNLFFSAIFSIVAYRQYVSFGSDAWKRLAKNGVQTMCFVVLCNIVCGVMTISRLLGNLSDICFVADWVITSILLTRHCAGISKAASILTQTETTPQPPNKTFMEINATITSNYNRIRRTTEFSSAF